MGAGYSLAWLDGAGKASALPLEDFVNLVNRRAALPSHAGKHVRCASFLFAGGVLPPPLEEKYFLIQFDAQGHWEAAHLAAYLDAQVEAMQRAKRGESIAPHTQMLWQPTAQQRRELILAAGGDPDAHVALSAVPGRESTDSTH